MVDWSGHRSIKGSCDYIILWSLCVWSYLDWTVRMAQVGHWLGSRWALGIAEACRKSLWEPAQLGIGGQGLGVVQCPCNWVKVSLVSSCGRTEEMAGSHAGGWVSTGKADASLYVPWTVVMKCGAVGPQMDEGGLLPMTNLNSRKVHESWDSEILIL